MWTALPAEGLEVFGWAVYQCLQRWTALQLAIHNEWGGSTSALKAQQLHSDLLAFFTRAKGNNFFSPSPLSLRLGLAWLCLPLLT